MNKNEYNALLHAIWRLDRLIADHADYPQTTIETLERDRKALSDLFVRLG